MSLETILAGSFIPWPVIVVGVYMLVIGIMDTVLTKRNTDYDE